MRTPETIEQDWDRFYRDFPEVYHRFALSSDHAVDAIAEMFGLDGLVVLDVGSGTGRSTLELARKAKFVVGLEPWIEMRSFSIDQKARSGVENVAFVNSVAEQIPIRPDSVDVVVSVYGFPFWFVEAGARGRALAEGFMRDAVTATRPGGSIVAVNTATAWRREELRSREPIPDDAYKLDEFMTKLGFESRDFDCVLDYGSPEEAAATYGFIYGRRAIDYIRRHEKATLEWRLRVHYKPVQNDPDRVQNRAAV